MLKLDVVNVACWKFKVPVPSGLLPSRKVTATPSVPPETKAVNVTPCPKVEGFGDELMLVNVTLVTGRVKTGDVLPRKLLSPL